MRRKSQTVKRLDAALVSLILAIPLSVIVVAIGLGERCGFYPGVLSLAFFGLLVVFTTPLGAATAIAMAAIGAVGRKRGVHINAAIVLVAFAAFAVLAIASMHGYVPWPGVCGPLP